MAWVILLVLAGYFAGAVPFGYLFVKWRRGIDVRTVGSGNIGATNAGRVLGKRWGGFILALDVFKGFLPTWIAVAFGPRDPGFQAQWVPFLTGAAAFAGHCWPVYLGFRGGKGVAVATGVFLAIAPVVTALSAAAWFFTALLTRYVSAASVVAALLAPFWVILMRGRIGGENFPLFLLSVLGGLFILILHRSNLRRIADGTERKIGDRKKTPEPIREEKEEL